MLFKKVCKKCIEKKYGSGSFKIFIDNWDNNGIMQCPFDDRGLSDEETYDINVNSNVSDMQWCHFCLEHIVNVE